MVRDVMGYRGLVHPDDAERFLANLEACLAGQYDTFRIEYRLRRADGSHVWVEEHGCSRRRGPDGRALELAGQCLDISHRKAIEAERDEAVALLHEAVDALPDGFLIYDRNDRIVLWNRRFEEMFPIVASPEWHEATGFADKMRIGLKAGLCPEAIGREEEWIEEILRQRASGDSEFELLIGDGRVIRYRDRLLPGGYKVGTRADLTALRAAEAEARAANARLVAAVELMPDGFVMFDRNDRFVRINRRVLELFPQWRREDVIGRTYREVLAAEVHAGLFPDAMGREAEWIEEVIAAREAAGDLFQIELRQACGRWVRLIDRRLDTGERIGLRTDVTALKVAAARLQAIIDGSGHAAWEWDIRSGAARIGAPWFAALGRDPSAFEGTLDGLRRDADPGDLARMERLVRDHLGGRSERVDATVRHALPDGGSVWFQVRGQVIERDLSGRPLKMAGVAIDVTEDRALRSRLEAAVATAEKATRAQVELMARMSHDIRTPLNGVLGAVSILGASVTDPQQRHLIEVAEQSGEHLIALIDEILDLSRIETGNVRLSPAPVVLADLADQIRAAHGIVAGRKGIEFGVLCDSGAARPRLGDRNRLLEVLHNLVGNAVKFTDHGSVEVSVRAPPEGPVRIDVRDSGLGMTADEVARLFQPFVQANASVAARYGGSGLGLSIVKKLVDLMDGSITVRSEPGAGTTMSVVLPLPQAPLEVDPA